MEDRIAGTPYSLHPGFKMEAASMKNLAERTGHDLDAWVALAREQGPSEEKECAAWLKAEHGFTTNYAMWVAGRAFGKGGSQNYDPVQLVEDMFKGRENLRPIYDKLLEAGLSLGDDVKVCPGKTIVPFYRSKVFAEAKPTTKTRLDLGLALGSTPTVGPLIDTGGYAQKDRITHRIPLSNPGEITDEVLQWLRKAYELAG